MATVRLADIRESPLSVDEVLAAVADPRAGGVDVFIGTVREIDSGREVVRLDYEAHPSATAKLEEIAEGVAADIDVTALAAVHRVGELKVGDLAVVAAASAGHRHEAFVACRKLIDDLKADVPIWKHQVFADGTDEWVGA